MSTATETTRTRNAGPSAKDFVQKYMEVHQNDGTNKDVANALKMSVNAVIARAKGYREKGINLPELRSQRRGKSIETNALNELISQMLRGEEEKKDESSDS